MNIKDILSNEKFINEVKLNSNKTYNKCNELVARDAKVVSRASHLSYYPLVVDTACESTITDVDGNSYIDFLSSASSLTMGSNNPVVTEAAIAQIKKCSQYTAAYTYNEPMIEYAERLVSIYPGGIPAKINFGNCGSDGCDAAIKFSRAFTGRSKVISFINGYHGNTYGSATLSTCTTRMKNKMGPFLPDIYSFPFFGIDVDDTTCEAECLKAIETAFATYLPAEEVASIIIEPLQGDGGMLPAHPIFMRKLHALCKANGILFISEEVQQGFFRTGDWFGINHYGIIPDGIVMGKSIGAGFTLGAFMARTEIMDCLPAPAHLFTLCGNHLACAAGSAAFDFYKLPETQKLIADNCKNTGTLLDQLVAEHPTIAGYARGLGFSYGVSIVKTDENGNKVPDIDGTFKILYRAYEYGLLIISVAGNMLRIQPPVVMTQDDFGKGLFILNKAMCDFENGLIPDEVLTYKQGW